MPQTDRTDRSATMRPYRVSGFATLLVALALAGCSRSSFLGRQFDDMTARYNTYYNAHRTFEDAEDRLKKEDQPIDMDRYLQVYEIPQVSGRSADFEKVITKCADLLRKHPHSKWVDDALMLIGKSYFYQTNYVGSEQKFQEVIALNGDLHDEAIFWLGRTLVASQSTRDAEDLIRTAIASEQVNKDRKPQLYMLLGDLRTDSKDWEGAIGALKTGLPQIHDGDVAARAQFLLGQLYETVGDYEKAVASYRQVQKYKPLYELSFAAMYSEYRVEGMHGDSDEALEGLQRMARDNKHYQYLDRIEYNRARVYAASGDPIASRRIFRDILYPPPGRPATSIRGEVHYRLGEVYRDLVGDFYLAAAHFDTASSVLRSNVEPNETYTPDAITNARDIADVFGEYRDVMGNVHEMDSLLYLGTLDDQAFDEAVQQVREQLAIEAARVAEELQRRQTQSSFQRNAPSESPAQQTTAAAGQVTRFGFLNFKDIQRVQEGYINFRRIWGDRPLIPGWRREEVVVSTRSTQQDELNKVNGTVVNQPVAGTTLNFLPPVDISNVPRDSVSRAKMESDRAAARYQLANILFLSMSLPDSAAYWYRKVVTEDSTEPVALRAEYALAEVEASKGDEKDADQMFAEIIREHPETEFADRARANLGIEVHDKGPDTLALAIAQYDSAYGLWKNGSRRNALDAMIRTAADHPHMDVGARAMLASAAIFSEMAQLDSVNLFGVMPVSDSLFSPEEVSLGRYGPGGPDSTSFDTTVVDSIAAATAAEVDSAASEIKPSPERGVAEGAIAEGKPLEDLGEKQAAELDLRKNQEADRPGQSRDSVASVLPPRDEDGLLERRPRPTKGRPNGEPDELPTTAAHAKAGPEDRSDETPIHRAGVPPENQVDEIPRNEAEKAEGEGEDEGVVEPAVDSSAVADSEAPPEQEQEPVVEEPQAPPPPAKPEWIEPEYFVNGVIPQPLTLYALLGSVETNFKETEFGERATALKRGLVAYRDDVFSPPDTTTSKPAAPALGARERKSTADSSLVKLER